MSPSQFHDNNYNTKREINPNMVYPSQCLKINKDSHSIKKSSSSASSSSASSASVSASVSVSTVTKPPRQPVIIYTHSPKVIHTNPNDFMALVQKLTGLSPDEKSPNSRLKKGPNNDLNKNVQKANSSDDSESSVVTDDSCPSTLVEDVHVNSCFPTPPTFESNINNCFNNNYNIPMFMPNEYLCSGHPLYNNYSDSLLFVPKIRSSTSSGSNLEAMKEFREF